MDKESEGLGEPSPSPVLLRDANHASLSLSLVFNLDQPSGPSFLAAFSEALGS